MTRNPIRRTGLVLLSLLLPLSAQDEKDLRELLRDALYTEEVTRDPEAAAKQYEALLSRHDAQRAFAASALFRLAEVRRKQERKDEAIALYQKLLARFPEAEAEAKLAREHLAALGGKLPSVEAPAADSDDFYIEHLRKTAESSPDRLQETFLKEISDERPKVVEFLLSQGVDPKTPKALTRAAEMGNLAICKLLLRDGKPSPEEAGKALSGAIQSDRIVVLSYLLEQGLDPDAPVVVPQGPLAPAPWMVTPLIIAVQNGKTEATRMLVEHGADIDFMVQSEGYPNVFSVPFGTALHNAVWLGNQSIFDFLLERGAKPDLATPKAGLTPLHLAARSVTPASAAMVKELLARGADPNRKSTLPPPDTRQPDSTPGEFALVNPFELALWKEGAMTKAEAMLGKGANPNSHVREGYTLLSAAVLHKQRPWIEFLLKAGADPDLAGKDGWTPLMFAAQIPELEAARLLLDAGADPNKGHDQLTPLAIASKGDKAWPVVELLVAKGAKPDGAMLLKAIKDSNWEVAMRLLDAGAPLPEAATSYPWEAPLYLALQSTGDSLPVFKRLLGMGAKLDEAWIDSGFGDNFYNQLGLQTVIRTRGVIPATRRPYLFRTFMLPRFEPSGDIRMVAHESDRSRVAILEGAKERASHRRSLAELLLSPAEGVTWPSRIAPTDRLIVWRKAGEEWKSVNEFAVLGDEAFPAVEPGDVLELAEDPKVDGRSPADSRRGPSPELTWSLRKRVSFPVTVEIDGKAREVTLRGDRLVFDPIAPDLVPLGGARKIMQLLWQPEIDLQDFSTTGPQSVLEKIEVVIRRDGWPDIRLPFSAPGKDFDLQSGDRISLEIPEIKPEQTARRRKDRVMVRATNAPFIRHFGNFYLHTSAPDPRTVPTLLQAIAEVTQVHRMQDAPRDPAALPAWLIERDWTLVSLQRPDLSRIRIRRLEADGSEKVIDVDLARIIAATPEGATSEEVRKADMTLQGGDIVEIPVLSADEAKPWSGLTPAEETFFSKALSCRIQVIDPSGNIRVQEIRYRAPKVVGTEAGPVPLPASDSVPSLNGSASLISTATPKVSREGLEEASINPWHLFLKEGYRVAYPAQSAPAMLPRRTR